MVKLVPELTAKRRRELRSPAEGLVYDECLTLNNDYTVIFSFRWIGTTAYGSPRDGETDFLVFHRTKFVFRRKFSPASELGYQRKWPRLSDKG